MDVRDALTRATDDGRKTVRQIPFIGEPFDTGSVLRRRERVLTESR
jgi:hypothetical protein